jgi:sialidase-1
MWSAPDASISQDALAPDGTVTAKREYVLTSADIEAGRLDAVSFEVLAANGAKQITATVTGGALLLDLQSAQPETVPVLDVQDLQEQTALFDLGTQAFLGILRPFPPAPESWMIDLIT